MLAPILLATALLIATVSGTVPPPSICHGRPGGFFVRDVQMCNGFFHCSPASVPTHGTCQSPWYFSQPQQRCLNAQDVQCFACPPGQPFVDLPFEGSCNTFVRCIDNQQRHLECGPGLQFDPNVGSCNLANLVNCYGGPANPPIQCPAIDDPNNRVFARDATDCSV